MLNIFSVTIIITKVIRFILRLFGKGKKENRNELGFRTPLRAPSRASSRDFKSEYVRGKRISSRPKCLPSRLPKTFPLTRNPSQMSLLGSSANWGTPFKPQEVIRNRKSTTDLQSTRNDTFERIIFPAANARGDDDLALDFKDNPANRSAASSNVDFHSAVEDLSSNDLHQGDCLRKSRAGKELQSVPGASTTIQRNTGERGRRFRSVPNCLPSRLTEPCPPLRVSPSHTNLLGLNKCTPFKGKGITRTRGSSTNLRNLMDNALDFSFPKSESIKARREASLQDYRFIPAAGDQAGMQLNEPSEDCDGLTTRNLRLRSNPHAAPGNLMDNSLDFNFPNSESIKARREASLQDYRFIPAAGDQAGMQLNEPSEGCDGLTTRNLRLRSNPHAASGCTVSYKHNCSKIPIRNVGRSINPKPMEFLNFPDRHRGRHTIKKNSFGMYGYQDNGDTADTPCIKSDETCDFIAFRRDTSVKFEQLFKTLSKRKHRSTGKMIDAYTHVRWMRLAGFEVDKDAIMFKNFAGGKVVLTFAEYKFLLAKISSAHELDYWDVLRKMATLNDELYHGQVFN